MRNVSLHSDSLRILTLSCLLLSLVFTGRAQQNPPPAPVVLESRFVVTDSYEPLPEMLGRLFKMAHLKFRYQDSAAQKADCLYIPAKVFPSSSSLTAALDYLVQHARPRLRYEVVNGVYVFSAIESIEEATVLPSSGDVSSIFRLSFSHDNQLLASGDENDRVTLWQMNRIPRGQFLGRIGGYAFSADGKTIVYGGREQGQRNQVFLRNIKTGETRLLGTHKGDVETVTHSPDGKLLVTSGRDKTIILWDAVRRELKEKWSQKNGLYEAIVSNDGMVAAWWTAGLPGDDQSKQEARRKHLLVWNSATRQTASLPKEPNAATGYILAAAFSPDGSTLAALSLSREILLWDARAWEPRRPIKLGWPGQVETLLRERYTLTFMPDSRRLAIGGITRGQVQIWDVMTGQREKTHADGGSVAISAIAFGNDGAFMATGRHAWWPDPGKLRVWDLANNKALFTLSTESTTTSSVAFRPKAPGIVATGGQTVRIWNFNKRGGPRILTADVGKDNWGRPQIMTAGGKPVFHPDGKILATLDRDARTVLFWDAERWTLYNLLPRQSASINLYTYSPDGKLFATCDHSGNVTLWDAALGQKLRAFSGLPSGAASLVISPDNSLLAAVGFFNTRTAIVWDITLPEQELPRRELLRLKSERTDIREDCIALGTEFIAYELDGKVKVQEIARDARVQFHEPSELQAQGVHRSPIFSKDGKMLLTESNSNLVFSNPRTGKELGRLARAGFSPRLSPKNQIVCRSGDGKSFQVFNVLNNPNAPARTLRGQDVMDNFVTFDSKEDYLGTTSGGAVRIWNLKTGRELLSLMTVGQEDYFAYTPGYASLERQNYYIASLGALREQPFEIDGKLYPFEQFELKLNRPDKILAAYGAAKDEEIKELASLYAGRLKKMGLVEKQLNQSEQIPVVSALNLPPLAREKRLTFQVEARDYRTTLRALKVYVNGVPVFGANGLSLEEEKSDRCKRSVEVELTHGRNRIDVQVQNADGFLSFLQTGTVECTEADGPRRLYALLVGVSKYKSAEDWKSLNYAHKDAEDLKALLKKLERPLPAAKPKAAPKSAGKQPAGGRKQSASRRPARPTPKHPVSKLQQFASYEKVEVEVLTNEQATRDAVLAKKEFLMQSRPQDIVVVLVAGHGWRAEEGEKQGEYFFATHEAELKNPTQTALSYEDLARLMDGIPARNKLMLLDTCNSGEADETPPAALTVPARDLPGDTRGSVKYRSMRRGGAKKLVVASETEQIQELFVDLRRDTGAAIISAASADEWAVEGGDFQNGVFTYSILQGITQGLADLDRDGQITVSELREYVGIKVTKVTDGRQKPTAVRQNLLNDFTLLSSK